MSNMRLVERLKMAVTRDSGVIGLISLSGGEELAGRSIHEFLVVVGQDAPDVRTSLRSWIPDAEQALAVVLAPPIRPGSGLAGFRDEAGAPAWARPAKLEVLYPDGQVLIIEAIGVRELAVRHLQDPKILLDRGGLRRVVGTESAVTGPATAEDLHRVYLSLVKASHLWDAGDRNGARESMLEAVRAAAVLMRINALATGGTISSTELDALPFSDPDSFGLALLDLLKRDLAPGMRDLPWDAGNSVRRMLTQDAVEAGQRSPEEIPQAGETERGDDQDPDLMCPICGGDEITVGRLLKKGTMEEIAFLEQENSWYNTKRAVRATVCNSCGHTSLRTKPRE